MSALIKIVKANMSSLIFGRNDRGPLPYGLSVTTR
jgi:hypothetical protein